MLAGHTKACLNKCWFAVIRSTHVTSPDSWKFITLPKYNYHCGQNQLQTILTTLICIKFLDLNHHSAFVWNVGTPMVCRVSVGVMMSTLLYFRSEKNRNRSINQKVQIIPIRTYIGTAPQHFHSIAIPELSDYREYQTDTNHLQQSHLHLLWYIQIFFFNVQWQLIRWLPRIHLCWSATSVHYVLFQSEHKWKVIQGPNIDTCLA